MLKLVKRQIHQTKDMVDERMDKDMLSQCILSDYSFGAWPVSLWEKHLRCQHISNLAASRPRCWQVPYYVHIFAWVTLDPGLKGSMIVHPLYTSVCNAFQYAVVLSPLVDTPTNRSEGMCPVYNKRCISAHVQATRIIRYIHKYHRYDAHFSIHCCLLALHSRSTSR